MISRTIWHGFEGLKLENNRLSTVIVPELGAKIASLYDKQVDHEWFASPTNPPRLREYGDTFTNYELCGWDEMFPTINECAYPLDNTITLPDHGEVWLLPWLVTEQSEHSITLSVEGRALDYRLTRSIHLNDDGVRLHYALENTSSESMVCLWAAHPLFAATQQTQILLPENVVQIVNVIPNDPVLGEADTLHDYPQQLDRVAAPTSRTCRKYYILPDAPISWAGLEQADKNCGVRLIWNAEELPYCGIWVDEGMYTAQATVAPEPSNGYYDSLVLAKENGRVATLDRQNTVRWEIEIKLLDAS